MHKVSSKNSCWEMFYVINLDITDKRRENSGKLCHVISCVQLDAGYRLMEWGMGEMNLMLLVAVASLVKATDVLFERSISVTEGISITGGYFYWHLHHQ